MKNIILFYILGLIFLGCSNTFAETKNQNLDGVWFICELSVSNLPPEDNCEMLDNDGFLVKESKISHLKIKNSKEENCRGGRKGHCFLSNTKGLKAKIRKIGDFKIGPNWVEVDYLSCTQRFWFTEFKSYWHGWPDNERCFWTRKKEFFIKRYSNMISIE